MQRRIGKLVDDIQRYDARRQEVRARILELNGKGVGAYDAELAVLNREIERFAARINRELQDCAKSGRKPGQVSVGVTADPELNRFLVQVKKTCAQLQTARPLGGKPAASSPEATALARDQGEARRLRQQIKTRQRKTDEEVRKTDRALDELQRDKKRLEEEEKRLRKQRQKLEREQERVTRDRDQSQAKIKAQERERANLEREKGRLLQRLRGLRQPHQRAHVEKEIQKINQSLTRQEHDRKLQQQSVDRHQKIVDSIDRELEQVDDALKRLEREQERLEEDERKRLEERKEQLQQAREEDDGRLGQLDEAEQSLTQATKPA